MDFLMSLSINFKTRVIGPGQKLSAILLDNLSNTAIFDISFFVYPRTGKFFDSFFFFILYIGSTAFVLLSSHPMLYTVSVGNITILPFFIVVPVHLSLAV